MSNIQWPITKLTVLPSGVITVILSVVKDKLTVLPWRLIYLIVKRLCHPERSDRVLP
jgi:hypothetical protein